MKRINQTFRSGPQQHLNACIGENSGTDNRYGYTLGFGHAVKVMLTAAASEECENYLTGEPEGVHLDTLIYPICFCARHQIELFLKREIHNVSQIRQNFRPAPMNHDLGRLWTEFDETCRIADRRLLALASPMEQLVLDYAEVDPTGATFRYAQNRKNKEHLTEIGGVINLDVLAQRFFRLSELIESFEIASEIIIREYRTGTYTTKLAREELFELASMLPARAQWASSPHFDVVRNDFREKYQLSSNDFQRALRLIQAHPTLSAIIGAELGLPDVPPDLVDKLHALHLGQTPLSTLTDEQWAAVDAIYQVGRGTEYPEYFQAYADDKMAEARDGRLDPPHLLRQVLYPNRSFAAGLRKLGQKRHFDKFEQLFPK